MCHLLQISFWYGFMKVKLCVCTLWGNICVCVWVRACTCVCIYIYVCVCVCVCVCIYIYGEWRYSCTHCNLGARGRWVVRLKPWLCYLWGRVFSVHWTHAGWAPQLTWMFWSRDNFFLSMPGFEPCVVQPITQPLYWLCYPGCVIAMRWICFDYCYNVEMTVCTTQCHCVIQSGVQELLHTEGESTVILWNVRNYSANDTVSQLERCECSCLAVALIVIKIQEMPLKYLKLTHYCPGALCCI
jgi:hypothetical protein